MLRDAERAARRSSPRGIMPGGMQFAYVVRAGRRRPYLEIAYVPPEIQTFFDYVKQEQK